jgi:threonine aldolase
MPNPIDFRSDTVTRPTPAMRQAMANAEVGDDVLGDDPTVLRLQNRIAEIMGKEAAVFVPSGTMANQTSIRAHTEPGDEVIAHEGSHIIQYETGAPAALSGVMIRPVPGPNGLFDAEDVDDAVRPRSSHFACSKLLVIENTHNRGGGTVWPLDQIGRVAAKGRQHGLRLHLDGARIWNASAATGIEPREYARHFDTVSCCFSKGLGAPAGSAVCGDAATLTRIHRFRKMFGGTMRQSGILAAAALHALEHHRHRLTDDHANARALAEGLAHIPGIRVDLGTVQTNMVFFELDPALGAPAEFCQRLERLGVRTLPGGPRRVRMVCQLDVAAADIPRAIRAIAEVAGASRPLPAAV